MWKEVNAELCNILDTLSYEVVQTKETNHLGREKKQWRKATEENEEYINLLQANIWSRLEAQLRFW